MTTAAVIITLSRLCIGAVLGFAVIGKLTTGPSGGAPLWFTHSATAVESLLVLSLLAPRQRISAIVTTCFAITAIAYHIWKPFGPGDCGCFGHALRIDLSTSLLLDGLLGLAGCAEILVGMRAGQGSPLGFGQRKALIQSS